MPMSSIFYTLRSHSRLFLATLSVALVLASPARAQTPAAKPELQPELRVQLNQLEQRDDMCLAYFLLHNATGHGLKDLQTELFVFDRNEVVSAHLRASFPDVRADKTVIKLFKLGSANRCDQVGGILINDVTACQTADDSVLDCLGLLKATSKSDVRLFK